MPTRFYFPLTTAQDGAITPSLAAWNYTTEVLRRKMVTAKPTGDAITQGSQIGPWTATAGQTAVDRQYISAPLAAGQTISGTVAMQLMVREFATTDNVDRGLLAIKVVSADGATLRATLLALGNYGPTLEFVNATSCRNKTFADGDAITTYTPTVAGDRIVVEIGYQNSTAGTTPEAAAKYGGSATDLPVNETQTTDGSPWIEFSANLTFQSISGTSAVTAGQPVSAAAGKLSFKATSDDTMPSPITAGAGVERFIGTSAETTPASVTAASGTVTEDGFTGTSSITTPAPTTVGAGAQRFLGASLLVAPAPITLASASERFNGTSSLITPVPVVSAAGDVGVIGTAAIVAPSPVVSAIGEVVAAGTSAITTPSPVISAFGTTGSTVPIGGGFIRRESFEAQFRRMLASRAVRGGSDVKTRVARTQSRGEVVAPLPPEADYLLGSSAITTARSAVRSFGGMRIAGNSSAITGAISLNGRGVVYLTRDQDDAEVFMLLSILQK